MCVTVTVRLDKRLRKYTFVLLWSEGNLKNNKFISNTTNICEISGVFMEFFSKIYMQIQAI